MATPRTRPAMPPPKLSKRECRAPEAAPLTQPDTPLAKRTASATNIACLRGWDLTMRREIPESQVHRCRVRLRGGRFAHESDESARRRVSPAPDPVRPERHARRPLPLPRSFLG